MGVAYAGSSSTTSVTTIIMALVTLLPVAMFAPSLSRGNTSKFCASLPVFVSDLKRNNQELYDCIASATAKRGAQCHAQINHAVVQLFGTYGNEVHSAFLMAVMLYIWCSADSKQSTLMFAFLAEYLATGPADLTSFASRCMSPYQSLHTAVNFSTGF